MTHINDLDPEVLYHILCLASGPPVKDIDKWKLKLTLLQVCTKWYDLFKDYVFFQGFVEIHPLKRNKNQPIAIKSCVYYADNDIVCRSNLGIIAGRDQYNCDCVSRLTVTIGHTLDIRTYGHILKRLSTLGVGYWLNLTLFEFYKTKRFSPPPKSNQPNLEELAVFASHYIHDFQNRLPNITHLDVFIQEDITLATAFWILIERYAQRLKHLFFDHSVGQRILPLFSMELTFLSIGLGNCAYQNLSIYAKPLQYLKLRDVSSSNFLWWIFHDFTTPGRIEFTNLKTLFLSYNEQANKEVMLSEKHSKQARPYGTHMLQFPKLESLTLLRPPVDCNVLFTDTIPTHLEKLDICGNCNTIVAASRLQVASVNSMHIDVRGDKAPKNQFYIATDCYFGYTKIGSTCEAIFKIPINSQRTVAWVNVTQLHIRRIVLDKLLELISNLYNLQDLSVENVELSNESLSIIRLGLEEEQKGEFKLLDTKVERIRFDSTMPQDPYSLIAILNHLLLRTTTLKIIDISYSQRGIVERSFLLEKFPHIEFSQ